MNGKTLQYNTNFLPKIKTKERRKKKMERLVGLGIR